MPKSRLEMPDAIKVIVSPLAHQCVITSVYSVCDDCVTISMYGSLSHPSLVLLESVSSLPGAVRVCLTPPWRYWSLSHPSLVLLESVSPLPGVVRICLTPPWCC
ncbi:hypothetical protein RRG08_009916 [Elysia crispata]|uniref:Uncharacterized protein n=1 Tax=Elysia crispata TaxID=231223 RepID=A0AAE1E3E6_9GAST|nr:hypothetical protein RRG08_009916 [Elysia crispata]